jgi:hypothetical protein
VERPLLGRSLKNTGLISPISRGSRRRLMRTPSRTGFLNKEPNTVCKPTSPYSVQHSCFVWQNLNFESRQENRLLCRQSLHYIPQSQSKIFEYMLKYNLHIASFYSLPNCHSLSFYYPTLLEQPTQLKKRL